jgi:hypothetical protein
MSAVCRRAVKSASCPAAAIDRRARLLGAMARLRRRLSPEPASQRRVSQAHFDGCRLRGWPFGRYGFPAPARASGATRATFSFEGRTSPTMAARKPARKKSAAAKPLRARSAHVRRRKPDVASSDHIDASAHMLTECAELPARLLRCRSPLALWLEYLRFGQRLLIGFQASVFAAPQAASPAPRPERRPARKASSTRR